MSNQLERVLPILATIPGVNIPVTILQGIYIAASQRRIEQFEQALHYEVGLLNQKIEAGKLRLDHEYIRSEAFTANVMQALRAAEVADCAEKLKVIARTLSGCALDLNLDSSLKAMCMRLIEQISYPEIQMLTYIKIFTDSRKLSGGSGNMSESEIVIFDLAKNATLCRGLLQLGLLKDKTSGTRVIHESHVWTLSSLAHDTIELCTAIHGIDEK